MTQIEMEMRSKIFQEIKLVYQAKAVLILFSGNNGNKIVQVIRISPVKKKKIRRS